MDASVSDVVETIGAANIDFPVEGCNGMNLARESVFSQQITIDRWHLNGKDTMGGGTPKQAMTVVSHVCHLIGAQTIGLSNGIEFAALLIGYNQTIVFLHLHLKPTVYRLCLGNILQNRDFSIFFQSLYR